MRTQAEGAAAAFKAAAAVRDQLRSRLADGWADSWADGSDEHDELNSLQIVLLHEMGRFNKLLKRMKTSLVDLGKAWQAKGRAKVLIGGLHAEQGVELPKRRRQALGERGSVELVKGSHRDSALVICAR